jgi:hypothetical protein
LDKIIIEKKYTSSQLLFEQFLELSALGGENA